MESLNLILPVLLYVFGIILLIVLIILGIRLLQILDRVDKVIDNVDEIVDNVDQKVNSFNGFFEIMDRTGGAISLLNEKMVESIMSLISRIFNKKKNKEDNDNE